jgi:two-component system, LytTR family, response regulator
MKQIIIPTDRGLKTVFVQNIIRVQANSNYSKIFFSNELPLTVAKVLHWFEDNLPNEFFIRIHKTHLVNRYFVASIEDKNLIHLFNGEILKISRRRKNMFHKQIAA